MKTFAGMGIAARLYIVSGALSLAFVGVAIFAWFNLSHTGAVLEQTASLRVPQLQRVSSTELEVTRVLLLLRHAILARSTPELERALDGIEEKRALVGKTLATFEAGLLTEAERARHARVQELFRTFWAVAAEDVALVKAGRQDEAFAFLVDKTVPARTALLKALRETVQAEEGALRGELADAARESQQTLLALTALAAVAVVGLGLLSWYAAAILGRRVAVSRGVAERVRDGDLTVPVHDEAGDEFSPLLSALDDMQGALSRLVADVRNNSEHVATASVQIAQGNRDLSERTEAQASALQQAAATMDSLGTTVRNNAENARLAEQLALGASSVVTRGGELVGQVVATMREIDGSSKKIADIITVIDGIAFQTNILALNAAVEAARAGEQGRGFAVVAGEVRNLAQRSAEAARQIKSLIADSLDKVGQGSALVEQAGSTMDEIVAGIGRVATIVGEISTASAEQSAGVGQVGQSVSQMDLATRQNAALVEESAAAADSLREQAAQLVQAVAAFKLAGQAGRELVAVRGER
ncbi:methyl-accepting chemotaxis protein [Massilia sp. IC2-476]|uniref:methyl-accepting chemotaxis protein n=1 Tax=Massilia sp. IC2-476 TaxID=2887199 RepID=UPI001D12B10A|nr:methyl-accepting chemotaxis protein [Massilia sp. IC2-476]MCC2973603.1 methyl-accepting chemotaxis protein [Massilia sp. IC2-476]